MFFLHQRVPGYVLVAQEGQEDRWDFQNDGEKTSVNQSP